MQETAGGGGVNILALDFGKVTGWGTYYPPADRDPSKGGIRDSGVQTFDLRRGESPGMRWLRFRAWLTEMEHYMNSLSGPFNLIVYERAHHRGGAATAAGLGYQTEVESFAARIQAELMPVHSNTLKKWATGSGRAGKPEMENAARQRGFDPQDDNEADAILLREYAVEQLIIGYHTRIIQERTTE